MILPVSFSAGIYQINQLITDFIAYPLGDGAISSLQYSRTLQEFPLGVIIISVSTICLPLFSRLLSEQNIHQLQSVFRRNFRMLFFIINPIVFITILCSEDIVRLLFKGYHFNQVSVNMTSICLTIHIIGLIPIFIAKMQQTLLFSF